jgi:hypothetical protein
MFVSTLCRRFSTKVILPLYQFIGLLIILGIYQEIRLSVVING